MDQNQNNDLFNFDNSGQEPPKPQEPQPPETGPGEPTIISGGAQVYNIPGQQPVEPPPYVPPSQQPVEPPPYVPPTPPPPYTPPPGTAAQPPRSSRNIWIIMIVVLVLLCCCCLAIIAVWLWNNGDQILNQFNSFVPAALQALV